MHENKSPSLASAATATAEWRRYWPLSLAALIGYSTIGLQSYGLGPFVVPLEEEFGWSRAQVMLGLSLSNFVGIFLNIIIGMIVDRFGPRRVALTGLLVKTGAFALLGAASGTVMNWSALWVFIAVGVVLVQSTVWISAVASRFDRARGMAIAVALSGSAITAGLAPLLATWLITEFGWRVGFVGVGAAWLFVTFPIVFLFFRGKMDAAAPHEDGVAPGSAALPGLTLREGVRTRTFACLLVSFGAFSFYSMAISSNLVPLLSENGAGVMNAAAIASVLGIMGFAARLTVGFLLDRFPANIIGAISQFLPVLGCAIFLLDDPGIALLLIAVSTFGIAIGAEMDVALYLATRHFGLKAFAALFGAIITFGALNATIGPMAAGWLHDLSGSYDSLLIVIMAVMTVGSVGIASVGRTEGRFIDR